MATDAREMPADVSFMHELKPLAKRLSAASDDLNQALLTIQDKLNALALGVEEWVPISATRSWVRDADHIQDQEWHESQLGYSQVGDGWALMTRSAHVLGRGPEGNGPSYEYSEERPLLRAPREVRLHAVQEIPNLIRLMKDHAAVVIQRVEDAKKIAESL